MTLTLNLWIDKVVRVYQLVLRILRVVPAGFLYALSFIWALLIGAAGSAEPVSIPHIENAFTVFFWLHFVLCFRVGLSIRNGVPPMSKIGWLIGLTALCIAIFTTVFEPSKSESTKFMMMFYYLVFVCLSFGWGASMLGEPIPQGPKKPMTLIQKSLFTILGLVGIISILFHQITAAYVAEFIKSIFGMPL